MYDPQGPLYFIKQTGGPQRGLGHTSIFFDYSQHNLVGGTICDNGGSADCPYLGSIRHLGKMFASKPGLPVTADADIAGPVGGFGWYLQLDQGAPKECEYGRDHSMRTSFVYLTDDFSGIQIY